MQALVQSHATSRPAIGHGHNHHISSLIIPWKPVPARTPPEWDSGEHTALAQGDHATTALSVLYASEYVNGNGYYLFSDHDRKMLDDPVCDKINTSLATTEKESSVQQHVEGSYYDEGFEWADDEPIRVFVVSLWYWWKEVTVIALSTAICLNILSNRFRKKFATPEVHKHIVVFQQTIPVIQPGPSSVPSPENTPSPFVSRYLDDFTPVQCLGRGGFGIVFEAKNKIDDCSYAVKRITLPYRKDKRDRVLREVRALAKLEHSHIVRYFNAWLEEPPPGWQDPFEKELKSKLDFTETYSKLPSVSHPNKKSILHDYKKNNICLNIQPEVSTNGHCDSACEKFKTPDFNRQRSYSMNDSFSIVFEKSFKKDNSNSENSEKSFSKGGKMFSLHNDIDDDEDSFVVFEEPKNSVHRTKSGDSVISISDSDFQIKPRERSKSKNMNDTQVMCIEETHDRKRLRRGHRKNLSLDLENISKRRMEPLTQMYLYIQMQLCRQESLRDWLRENTSPDVRKAEVVTIFEQIVHAVEYVHLQGLIHRDLKPSNIFFAVDGRVKIGDFGLVTAMVDSTDQCRSPVLGMPDIANYKHTQHVGTHLYMSPEQLRGEPHGYKVDIWSLGLVLMELLIPFSTEMERVTALGSVRDHKFPKDFVENHPQEHSLLLLMLSMDPSRRPSTLGVRARAPLLHHTDPRYHFSLPPRSTHNSIST